MTIDVFWQQIETAIREHEDCSACPVKQHAEETNSEPMCDMVNDCADGLMMLHKKLQDEERQKMEWESNED
ncbi:hypothetical protein SAMN05216587_101662 [Selenomonas ruminantium]|uniref:Uncharacterized protein n=1 Tax=Selenomonas ruminantium TaxID=971 RepID=A0A1I0VJ27_SELRU|nr:hypothetical protein SAMN05216587_101662 [Selenomonas ruminantium]